MEIKKTDLKFVIAILGGIAFSILIIIYTFYEVKKEPVIIKTYKQKTKLEKVADSLKK